MKASALTGLMLLLLGGSALAGNADNSSANSSHAREAGYQRGYHDGYSHALTDREESRRPDPNAGREYKIGYRSDMGNREAYKEGYRDGFGTGYADGLTGQSNRLVEGNAAPAPAGTAPSYATPRGLAAVSVPETAAELAAVFDLAYRVGRAAGRQDARQQLLCDPNRHSEYEDATAGYTGAIVLDAHKEFFRHGYFRGYADGFGRVLVH